PPLARRRGRLEERPVRAGSSPARRGDTAATAAPRRGEVGSNRWVWRGDRGGTGESPGVRDGIRALVGSEIPDVPHEGLTPIQGGSPGPAEYSGRPCVHVSAHGVREIDRAAWQGRRNHGSFGRSPT